MATAGGTYARTFFKGAGPGTHWHVNDARLSGFLASPRPTSVNAIVTHVGAYSHPSAFLSVTSSFAVARSYALLGPGGPASTSSPGYVYEIDFAAVTTPVSLFDPVHSIASGFSSTGAHLHDGNQDLLTEVASGLPLSIAPQLGGTKTIPAVSKELRALIFSSRDAEILVHGGLPAGAVVYRHDVW
jgi:hypothetical protein